MIYGRVSTDRQADAGGIDVQVAACRRWCRENGRRVVGAHLDEGVSGSLAAFAGRTGWLEAVEQLRAGAASEIVVYRIDRVSRELVLQETLLAEVTRLGGRIRSTSPAEDHFLTDDPDDPARRLVRQVLGAVAGYERDMIRLRMRAGRARKQAAGGYAGGRPPLGRRAVAGELEQLGGAWSEQLAAARRRRRAGLSLRAIADELGARPDGRPWHPQQLARALARH